MLAIHDLKIAADVCNRVLGTPLMITCQELLSLAPEVCAQLCDDEPSGYLAMYFSNLTSFEQSQVDVIWL